MPETPKKHLVEVAVVDFDKGTITLDGEEFPYHVSEEVSATVGTGQMVTLNLKIQINTKVHLKNGPSESIMYTQPDPFRAHLPVDRRGED